MAANEVKEVSFLKKVWVWVKHHWYIPVALVLALLCMILCPYAVKNKYFEILMRTREDYQKEIDLINKANQEKEKKKEKLFEQHKEIIDKIEEEHDIELKNLKTDKQKEISDLVEKYDDEPDELAKEIARVLSAEYIRKEREK